MFFARLEEAVTGGAATDLAHTAAFTAILPWQVACYVAAAALMFLLPRRASASP